MCLGCFDLGRCSFPNSYDGQSCFGWNLKDNGSVGCVGELATPDDLVGIVRPPKNAHLTQIRHLGGRGNDNRVLALSNNRELILDCGAILRIAKDGGKLWRRFTDK